MVDKDVHVKKKRVVTKPQKLKTISFQDWCKENNRQDLMDRWDYDLNKYTPDIVACKSAYQIYFKCPAGLHKSKSRALYSITCGKNACECEECYLTDHSFGKWCEDNHSIFLSLWDYDKNAMSPYQVEYASTKKFYFKCERGIHESHLRRLCDISKHNSISHTCSKCGSIGQWVIDNYGREYLDMVWDYDKNIKSPFEISRGANTTKIFVKCVDDQDHPSYPVTPDNYTKGRRCPMCKQERTASKLQENVRKYILEQYQYDIKHEYACDLKPINPKTNYVLPYDNQVNISENVRLIIEVMGVQHYKVTGYIKCEAEKYKMTPDEALLDLQRRDSLKKDYALSNGYAYLAIPYWTEEDMSYKKLIDDKILSITKQND